MIPPLSDIIKSALAEDIGRGDITTNSIVDAGREIKALLIAREDLVVCGLPVFSEVFKTVDARVRILPHAPDGSGAMAGNVICTIRGPARAILTAERVALNFFQNLSAVATMTRRFVEKVTNTNARIVDTRKTTPGLRLLQKYAVRTGGGYNHRMGLDDGVLIKDNHISLRVCVHAFALSCRGALLGGRSCHGKGQCCPERGGVCGKRANWRDDCEGKGACNLECTQPGFAPRASSAWGWCPSRRRRSTTPARRWYWSRDGGARTRHCGIFPMKRSSRSVDEGKCSNLQRDVQLLFEGGNFDVELGLRLCTSFLQSMPSDRNMFDYK